MNLSFVKVLEKGYLYSDLAPAIVALDEKIAVLHQNLSFNEHQSRTEFTKCICECYEEQITSAKDQLLGMVRSRQFLVDLLDNFEEL